MKILPSKYKLISIFATLIILFYTLPATPVAASTNKITLDDFITALSTTNSSKLAGVFVKDTMALRVIRQSSDDYVSNNANTATRFNQADKFGSIGLLAHNYLSGAYFSKIDIGTKIYLVYGDGSSKEYTVTAINQYQALSPDDPYSKFINLDKPDVQVSSANVVYEMYGTRGSLVLQTCISKDGNINWGRHFIIASPATTE